MITVNLGTAALDTAMTILAPSLANTTMLVLAAHHEAGDVLQKQ